jgi:hypothetical protein
MRQVKVEISKAVLSHFFQESERAFRVTKGLPEDAKLIRIQHKTDTGNYVATFESEQFDNVGLGNMVPTVAVEYTAYAVGDKSRIVVPN